MKLVIGQTYEVKVEKIVGYGAIVKMEDGTTQLLHISNISDRFVKNIEDYVKVGDTIKVDCIVGKVKPEELSTKAYTKDIEIKSN